MKCIYALLLVINLTFFNSEFCYSQTDTTNSKSCGKCGKSVSVKSKIGDTCPHCGVRWGYENSQTTSSTTSTYSYPNNYPSTDRNKKNISEQYIVTKNKAFFHNDPNDESIRKAYLIKGQQFVGIYTLNGFVYAEFTNSNGRVTNGWIKKSEITPNNGNTDYFTIGSNKSEVLRIQGNPTSVQKFEFSGSEVWHYEFSSVTFKNGRVHEYSNISKNLKVHY